MLKCECCGVESEEVETCLDPQALEFDNEEIEIDLCDVCFDQRCMDI